MADTKGDFLVGLFVGSALGAALALLYAPQSGDETRDTIKRKGTEIKESAADIYDQVKEQTTTIASQVKDSATNLASNVKDSATSAVSNTSEAISRTKEDINIDSQDVKNVLRSISQTEVEPKS